MALLQKTYGKDHVRVMRIDRSADRHEVRELTVRAMLTGHFDGAFTEGDNSTSVATDTVKNIINVVARENITLGIEQFCAAVGRKLLDLYPDVDGATVTGHETKWARLVIDGAPHAHSFLLDSNGKPFAKVVMTRGGMTVESGLSGLHLHENDPVRLGELYHGQVHNDSGDARSHGRDRNGRVLGLEGGSG